MSSMELTEIGELTTIPNYGIMINRASVKFDNFNCVTSLTNVATFVDFFYTAWNFFMLVEFYNIHFEVKGRAYINNVASANILATNLTLDLTSSLGGFNYISV